MEERKAGQKIVMRFTAALMTFVMFCVLFEMCIRDRCLLCLFFCVLFHFTINQIILSFYTIFYIPYFISNASTFFLCSSSIVYFFIAFSFSRSSYVFTY